VAIAVNLKAHRQVCHKLPGYELKCVLKCHKDDVDFEIIEVLGKLVLDWSMPSIMMVRNFSGSDLDFSLCW